MPLSSQKRLRWLALVAVCALLLGLSMILFLGIPWPGLGRPDGKIDQSAAAQYRPALSAYRDIPLPMTPPPDGAVVRAPLFANPAESGQQIRFEYPDFTVSVCSVDTRTAAKDACTDSLGPDREIRRVTEGPRVTRISATTKSETKPAGSLAARTIEFFKSAPLAPRPTWMHAYVERLIKEILG